MKTLEIIVDNIFGIGDCTPRGIIVIAGAFCIATIVSKKFRNIFF